MTMVAEKRGPGKPRIGRHMQTRVPDDLAEWIEEEARRTGDAAGCPETLRRVIAAGVSALAGEA
jgi:hypothetical protein